MNATVSIPVTRPSAGRSIERGTDAGLERPLPVDRNRTNRDRLVDDDRRCPLVAVDLECDPDRIPRFDPRRRCRQLPVVSVGVDARVSERVLGTAAVGLLGSIARPFLRGTDSDRRLGTAGTVTGVGIVAAVVAWYGLTDPVVGLGPQSLGGSVFLLGSVGYAVVGEYERLRLRESFSDRTGARPSSPIE